MEFAADDLQPAMIARFEHFSQLHIRNCLAHMTQLKKMENWDRYNYWLTMARNIYKSQMNKMQNDLLSKSL